MPQLNNLGEWCSGFSGAPGVQWGWGVGTPGATGLDFETIENNAGGANWLNDDKVIFQGKGLTNPGQEQQWAVSAYNVRTKQRNYLDPYKGANTLYADAGIWAAWAISGVRISENPGTIFDAKAGLEHVGPDGAICLKDDYQASGPFTVYETSGEKWQLTTGAASQIRLLGNKRACWVEGGNVKTIGSVPIPNPMTRPFYWLRMMFTPDADGWWVMYQEDTGRLLLHPATSLSGYILAPAGSNTYFPDMVRLSDDKIRVAWSITEGEEFFNVRIKDINPLVDTRTVLGTAPPPVFVPGTTPGGTPTTPGGPTGTGGLVVPSITLRSEATFQVVAAAEELIQLPVEVWPSYPIGGGHGRIVHPILGAFDYEVKPDEWVNIDADAIISPVWASTRTLTSAANVLWSGNLRDVVIEERWKALGGLSMPVTQLRMLLAIWTTPIDPDAGYVHWYPNYITQVGFKVLPVLLTSGGQGVTFDDVVNYLDEDDNPIGWMTNPVTFTLKLVERL